MNIQTTITAAALPVGTTLHAPSKGLGYVLSSRPPEHASHVIGANGLEAIALEYEVAFPDSIQWIDNIAVADMIDSRFDTLSLSEAEVDGMRQRAQSAMDQKRQAHVASMQAATVAQDERRARIAELKPAGTEAAIIAVLHADKSDSMSDYFNSERVRTVLIGWSAHKRDLFPELRKAAARFPEAAHLADADSSAEHREKYSMGAGYYLKQGGRYHDGWSIEKTSPDYLASIAGLEFADCLTSQPEAPAVQASAPGGFFTMSQHVHTKKGFTMWICELAGRIDRADFMAYLEQAKALGGWYSKAWAGTPAGFAFKVEAKALEFMGENSGSDPEPSPGKSIERKAKAPGPVNLAPKLREMADALQSAIDDKFRDRLSNTPKRAKQAAQARQEGYDLERAQKAMRALAALHEAGDVPPLLAGFKTRAAIVEATTEAVDYSRGGYYSPGQPQGVPRFADRPEAVALYELAGRIDPEAAKAAELKAKIDGLRFSKIESYFPTPPHVVARMVDAANIQPGQIVLEPSAGSGAIADAARDAGAAVTCIEKNWTLAQILEAKGHLIQCERFEEVAPGATLFDAVLMNPPFEQGQDVAHVLHAWEFLKPGGVLVAVMSAGVTFRSDKRTAGFRDFVQRQGGELVKLPAGTFKDAGTMVETVLLTLWKESE